ncbi:MAG TPA: flippase activity-associated protein Agl23, partial [Thermoanaerobaculia bacterium]|nr:flippase activity-associated protein Agl23 [Thermoanaerobaculia bacterium]
MTASAVPAPEPEKTPAPVAESAPLDAPRPMPQPERRAWTILLVLAAVVHLWSLGDRPFHHDESVHAWFCDHLATEGDYKYDPVYHGPVQYAMVASTFKIARTLDVMRDVDKAQKGFSLANGDFLARLPAALGGVALVWMALLLRPRFGPRPALFAGALAAFSPNLLYYTRFCREDIWSLLGTAGMFLFFDAWWRERRLKQLALAALFAAVAFAAKENFYVLMVLMGPSLLAYCWEPGGGVAFWRRLHRFLDFLEENTAALAGALLLFFCVSELLYTVFLIHLESGNPAKDAITYWWGQHKVARVGGPKHYYIPRLLQYEFAILVPAFAYIFGNLRRLTAVERFLAAWGISSLAMYAYLGEKTPWLIVHQILPFIPLAALEWARLWEAFREGTLSLPKRVLAGAGAAASVLSALSLSFFYPSLTPKVPKAESVIYVQTSPEVLDLVARIRAEARPGVDPVASVIGEASWPLNWYLRRLPVSWAMPEEARKPPV